MKWLRPRLLGWLGACLMLAGISLAQEVSIEYDIAYGMGGDEVLKLDLARPKAGDGPFPALVLIHGGGGLGGNRAAYRELGMEAARRGYVALMISYRLTKPDPVTQLGTVRFPAQLHDCKCAIRWLRANAEKYRVDNNCIAVAGSSAGGCLSLLVGLTDATHQLEGAGGHGDHSSRVQAVVNFYGPTDMLACWQTSPAARPYIKSLIGAPEQHGDAFRAASPLSYSSPDDPPVLTLHGDQDTLIPPAQATLLDEKLKAAGAPHELVIIKGAGHGFNGATQKQAHALMWGFLEKHLQVAK